jgi:hypothetical protein
MIDDRLTVFGHSEIGPEFPEFWLSTEDGVNDIKGFLGCLAYQCEAGFSGFRLNRGGK